MERQPTKGAFGKIDLSRDFAAPPVYALRSIDDKAMHVQPTALYGPMTRASFVSSEGKQHQTYSRIVPKLSIHTRGMDNHNHGVSLCVHLKGNTPLAMLASKKAGWMFEPSCILYIHCTVRRDNAKHLFIHSFYSRAQQDKEFAKKWQFVANASELHIIKGIGRSALCFLLTELVKRKILTNNDLVALEASGGKQTSDKPGADPDLIPYYMSIGFQYPNPQSLFYAALGETQKSASVLGQLKSEPHANWQESFAKHYYVLLAAPIARIRKACAHAKHLF